MKNISSFMACQSFGRCMEGQVNIGDSASLILNYL